MHLKTLAKRWQTEDKQATFYLIPYATLKVDVVNDELAEIVPEEKWALAHNTFVGFLGYVVDVEFADTLSSERQGLKAFMEAHTGRTAEDWPLFQQVCGSQTLSDFWAAYHATRDTAVEQAAPVDEGQKKDENAA